jgi:hypothetical protein
VIRDVDVRDQRRGLPGSDRVFEYAFRGADIRNRVRTRVPDEAIVLDQSVVGPAGEGEDRQLERVERRHAEQRRVGIAGLDLGTIEAMKVVTDEDVVRAQPADEFAMCLLECHSSFAFPDAFLALPASGHCVEDTVPAKLDIDK